MKGSLLFLFLLGLALRLPGLPLHGMSDQDWQIGYGLSVLDHGFGKGFYGEYMPIAYGFFAICAAISRQFPPLTWMAHKSVSLIFEIGILVLLAAMVKPRDQKKILWFFWLNPFFMLQGAYLGLWDGPTTFFAVLSLYFLMEYNQSAKGWLLAGLAAGTAAMIKPQGFFHYTLGYGAFLLVNAWLSRNPKPLIRFFLGYAVMPALVTAVLVATGGKATDLFTHYLKVVLYMPILAIDGVNIWWFLSYLIELYQAPGLSPLVLILHFAAAVLTIGILFLYAWKVNESIDLPTKLSDKVQGAMLSSVLPIYTVVALATLLVPQIGTKGHINHIFGALVLFLPLALYHRALFWLWISSVGIHLYAYLIHFQFGISNPVNVDRFFTEGFPVFSPVLLKFQEALNQWALNFFWDLRKEGFSYLLYSLSLVQFILVCLIIREMFRLSRSKPVSQWP